MTKEKTIFGIGASEGIRIGKAFIYRRFESGSAPVGLTHGEQNGDARTSEAYRSLPTVEGTEQEMYRLELAKEASIKQLDGLVIRIKRTIGDKQAGIIEGQVTMLNDPAFYGAMQKLIREDSYDAETAVDQITQQISAKFAAMNNDYLRERASDIRDVGGRLLNCLSSRRKSQLIRVRDEAIWVADDLTPSETVQLDPGYVLGLLTAAGGQTSHTAILARALGIAAVVGAGEEVGRIEPGNLLILDGHKGVCIINPNDSTLEEYRLRMEQEKESKELFHIHANQPALTVDGVHCRIKANIGSELEAQKAVAQGCEGIGLYRTEFLYMQKDQMPQEEEQFYAYKEVTERLEGKSVVIRTLDIGGDKELPYWPMPKEQNPFLGYRAIRFCLGNKDVLVTQLRAILRASAFGRVKIMIPMISGLDEWRQAKALCKEVMRQLEDEQIPFDPSIEVGMMVETPSAVLLADRFAREADFFSIGTNDLVQYTLAVDRLNERVAYLYDYFHPAVIRSVQTVIEAAHRNGKRVSMCGGMAGDPLAAPLLVGLGLDEWSMEPSSITRIKQTISQLDSSSCHRLVEYVQECDTPQEVREQLEIFRGELSENI